MYRTDDPASDWDRYYDDMERNATKCPKCNRVTDDLYDTDYGRRCPECLKVMRSKRLASTLKRVNKIIKEDIEIMEEVGVFADGNSWDDGWNWIAENLGLDAE